MRLFKKQKKSNHSQFLKFQAVVWKMLAKIAGMDVINNKGSVAGVVLRVFAVEKVGKAMNAMDHLEEKLCMHVY